MKKAPVEHAAALVDIRQLWLCLKMSATFPNPEIVNTVCAEFGAYCEK
ncbi:MAG: hypothetical protein PHD43_14000 [Methylococcales bacterium]|nr:hypothetical protein [Methylococcales bacterium]